MNNENFSIGYVPIRLHNSSFEPGTSLLCELEYSGSVAEVGKEVHASREFFSIVSGWALTGTVYPTPAVEFARHCGGAVWVARFFAPRYSRDPFHGRLVHSTSMRWLAPLVGEKGRWE